MATFKETKNIDFVVPFKYFKLFEEGHHFVSTKIVLRLFKNNIFISAYDYFFMLNNIVPYKITFLSHHLIFHFPLIFS